MINLKQVLKRFSTFNNLQKHSITFITPENENINIHCEEGSTLLEIAHNNDIELEGIFLIIRRM